MADDVLVEQDTLDTITVRNQFNGGIPILDPNGKIYEHYLPEVGGSGTVTSVNGIGPDSNGNVTIPVGDVTYDSTNAYLKYNNGSSTVTAPKFTDKIYTPTIVGTTANGSLSLQPSSTANTGQLVLGYNSSGGGSIGLSLSNASSLGVTAESININTGGLNIGNDGNLSYYTTFGNISIVTEAGSITLNGYTGIDFAVQTSNMVSIDSNANLSIDGNRIRMKGANNTTWDITIDANGNLITTQVVSQ